MELKDQKDSRVTSLLGDIGIKNKNIYTQEKLAKWMRYENIDKESLLIRATRHYKWLKFCEKKYLLMQILLMNINLRENILKKVFLCLKRIYRKIMKFINKIIL